ncbi:MAG TPA: thioredoxin domain-containing protein, partial [Microbacterium sp.]|nr:thioredoxin domain-containing protein [Microbacterium sp.]
LEPPAVDGKVITGWNGIAIRSLARAGAVLGEQSWVRAAAEAASAVLDTNVAPDGSPVRASLDGKPSPAVAGLADLGLLAEGLFALAAAGGEARWAVRGREILDRALAGVDPDPVLSAHGVASSPDQSDGDLPSGASAVAAAALAAWRLGAGERYRDAAVSLVEEHAERALAQPFAHSSMLQAAAWLAEPPRQVVVVTASRSGALAKAALRTDADVIAVVAPEQAQAFADAGFELFEAKGALSERAYDCRAFVCRLPVSDPADLHPER